VPSKDIHDKYLAALQDGTAPDLVFAGNASLGQDARDGNVAELSSLGGDWQGDYRSVAMIGMTVDNGVYGVPLAMNGVALVYNTSYITDPPADTGALVELIKQGIPVALPVGCYWDYGFFNAFGGRIFGDDWSVVADQESGDTDALQYLYDLYRSAKSSGLPTDYEETSPAFQKGTIALTIDGNWNIAPIRAALGDGERVAPLPSGPGGGASPLIDVYGFYINPNSQAQEAAMQGALYLSNKDSSETMMQSEGFIPANTTVDVSDPIVQGFLDSFDNGTAWGHYPEFTKYWNNFCDMQPVFDGSTAPEPWLKNATASANQ
jgi:arabinogalactan oligomer/maltooligosaccharide transport system substrate-binding protein